MPELQPRRFILASNSPRRRELLTQAGYSFEVMAPDPASESGPQPGESAEHLVARLAAEKADQIAAQLGGASAALILAADTVAECDGKILGKPDDREHAGQILRQLRGKIHRVFTGICLWQLPIGPRRIAIDVTTLQMEPLSDQQIEAYLHSGLWQGKAGAFGYQDGIDWVRIIQGSPSNVVGLPMELLTPMLHNFGVS
jgi:septum formation protein